MTSPGAYSAGTAFLDVVPSFRGVQEAIRREVGKMERALGEKSGDEFGKGFEKGATKAVDKALDTTVNQAEKAGKDAAQKYAGEFADHFSKTMQRVQREMKAMNFAVQPLGFDKLRKDIEALSKAKIGKDMDAGPAVIEMNRIAKKIDEIQDKASHLEFRHNLGSIAREFDAFRKKVEKDANLVIEPEIKADRQLGLFEAALRKRAEAALEKLPPVEVDADVSAARAKMMQLRADLQRLRNGQVGVDFSGSEASAEMERIRREFSSMAGDKTLDIQVRTDAAGAAAELLALRKLAELVDNTKVDIEVKVDMDKVDTFGTRLHALRNRLQGTDADGQDAANSFRAFNAVVLLGAAALAGVAPLATAAAGAIALFGAAALGAAAGLGVMMFGFSGISDAVKALSKEQENGAKEAQTHAKALRTAANSVSDAERSVERARTNAARAARDGAEAVENAIQQQRDAERNLISAQRDAVRAQQDVAEAQRDVTRARQEAAEQLEDLRLRARGGELAERQAVLDLKEAEQELRDARRDAGIQIDPLKERDAILDLQDAERKLAEARRARPAVVDPLKERDAVLDLRQAGEKLADARRRGVTGSDLDRLALNRDKAASALKRVRNPEQDDPDLQRLLLTRDKAAAALKELRTPEQNNADIAQLVLNLDQARLRVDEVRESNGDLRQEQAEWARTGVEGSEQVVAAQGRVRDAQDRVVDSQARVADAANGVRDAEKGVADARRDAAERAADSQQAILDAQENLLQAQERLGEAQAQVGESARAADIAMGKLGPAGQKFALFILGLKDDVKALRDITQEAMLPGVQSAIDSILRKNGPLLRTFLGTMGGVIGGLFKQFGDLMTSPQWQAIWATFTQYAPTFFSQFAQVGMNMMTAFGELFVGLAPYAETFGDALVRMSGAFADWMADFVRSDAFRSFMAWLFENGPIIWDTLSDVFRALGNILIALEPLGMLVLGALDGIAEWIADMDPQVLGGIITAILGLVFAFQLAAGAMALVSGAFAILSSPFTMWIFIIGAVITGLIVLYTQSETARKIIDGVFHAIGAVLSWLWDNVVMPVFGALQAAWDYLVQSFSGGGGVLGTIIQALGDFFSWLWHDILQPIFSVWQVVWGVLWDFMVDTWNRVGLPIFKTLWDIVVNVWEIIGPIFQLIGLAFRGLWWLAEKAWKYVGKPIFDAIVTITKFLWKNVFSVIFKLIVDRWEFLWAAIELAWTSVGKPVFDFIEAVVKSLVEIFQGNFDKLGDIWKKFWETLKVAAAKPINFVIHFVLNKGLFGAFNWIIEKLGLNKDWKITPWDQVGPQEARYAAGGRVAGWSPHDKADNIPAWLTAGEFVHPVNTVDYYGTDVMDAIRKKRIPREVLAQFAHGGLVDVPRFAVGGTVDAMWAWVKARHPYARLTSDYRPGDPGYHGRRQAIDVAGQVPWPSALGRAQMLAINRDIAKNFPNATELIHTAPGAVNLWHGAPHTYNWATRLAHMNHVHFAMAMLSMMKGGRSSGGGSFGTSESFISSIFGGVGDVLDKLKDGLGKLDDLGDVIGTSTLSRVLTAAPKVALKWIWDKVSGPIKDIFAGFLDTGEVSPNLPKGELVSKVQGVAALYGWGKGAQWNALSHLIQGESGWNPLAQNPTSTAFGLFQFLNSTWAGTGFEKTSDPLKQTQAGLTYIKNTYGDPVTAYRMWSSRAPHWYAEGGEVGPAVSRGEGGDAAPTLYDTGGWLPPGLHTVLNASNRPEPILTAAQWDELVAARRMGEAGGRGFRELHLHEQAYDVSESVATLNHAVKVLERSGRYGQED